MLHLLPLLNNDPPNSIILFCNQLQITVDSQACIEELGIHELVRKAFVLEHRTSLLCVRGELVALQRTS